jgi:Tfp pilus assembly protein PilO
MKRDLSRRELLLYGLPVLGLLVGILGYFVFVSPQKAKADHLSSEIDGAQAALIAAHQKPSKPVSPHAVDLFRLTKAMPDSNDVPGLLIDLSRLAHASKVSLQSVKPGTQVPLTLDYAALPIDIVVNGTFTSISDFLQRLRSQVTVHRGKISASGRLLIAKNVQLAPGDGKSLQATLSLDAFVYGVAPPPAPTPTTTTTG